MKKIIFLFLFVFSFQWIDAQQNENTFQQSENNATGTTSATSGSSAAGAVGDPQELGPGNPPGDVPINNAIPILAIVAIGMIVYSKKYRILKNQ